MKTKIKLPEIFNEVKVRPAVLHEAVVSFLSTLRCGSANTKTKSEVNRTGKKPFAQKGTGRARQGSWTNPHHRGGGVAFGPKPRDYSIIPMRKVFRNSIMQALKQRQEQLYLLEDAVLKIEKSKDIRKDLGVKEKMLFVLESGQSLEKAVSNYANVKVVSLSKLAAYHLMWADQVLFQSQAWDQLGKRYFHG